MEYYNNNFNLDKNSPPNPIEKHENILDIVHQFNILMKDAIMGPDCTDPNICHADCCHIHIDIPKILAQFYIDNKLAKKDDFIRGDVFAFKIAVDQNDAKCVFYDKDINGCSLHNTMMKPPQCWIYPTGFENGPGKEGEKKFAFIKPEQLTYFIDHPQPLNQFCQHFQCFNRDNPSHNPNLSQGENPEQKQGQGQGQGQGQNHEKNLNSQYMDQIHPHYQNNDQKIIVFACKKTAPWRIVDENKTNTAKILFQKYTQFALDEFQLENNSQNLLHRLESVEDLLIQYKPSQVVGFRDTWDQFVPLITEGISLSLKKFCSKVATVAQLVATVDEADKDKVPQNNCDFLNCRAICTPLAKLLHRYAIEKIPAFVKMFGPRRDYEFFKLDKIKMT